MKVLMQIDSPNVRRAYESTLPMFSVEFVTEETKEVTKAQTIAQEVTGIAAMSDPPEETTESEETEESTEDKPNSVKGKSDPPEKTTGSKTESPIKDKSDPPEKTTAATKKTTPSIKDKSDPPESTTSQSSGAHGTGSTTPNKTLYYADIDDFAYAMADFENWYNREIIGYYDNLLRGNSQSGNTNTSDSDDDWDYNFGSDDSWVDDFDCEQLHYDIVTTILKILAYNHYDLDYYGARYMDVDASEYEEYWMVYYLIRDVRTEMMMFEDDDYAYETDLGSGKPSVLEVICAILGIDKPEYVDYHEGTSSQILDIDEFEVDIPTYGLSPSGDSVVLIDRYRINPGDTSHDAEYGYDREMAETIERILESYSERDLVGYINMNYDDEELFELADEMITYGALVDDYGYTTLLVYLLAKYPNDPVISAIVSGGTIPALYRYIYFDEYDDYGTNWGEPYFYDTKRSVWKITDSSEIENNQLLDDPELCRYIYKKYGDVCLAVTASTYSDYKYPFWITNWEIDISKAQYCRDWIVPSVMGVIDKYCREKHNFSLDCLNADAKPVTFSAGGSSHTGLLITVFDRNYIGSELVLNSKKIYLDLKTGALYDGNSVLGYIDLED